MRYTSRYRSFFWPAVLILAGVIALLVNTGQISVERLGLLFALWPLILIVIGLEIIVRRSVQGPAGDVAAAGIVIVALVGAAVYVAASPNPSATHSLDSTAPAGGIDAATLEINVGAATINVSGDPESNDLYRAHVDYTGQQPTVHFDASSHTLRIDQSDNGFNFFGNRKFAIALQLNQDVRWAITENSGAATITNDLAHMHLSSLNLNTGASKDDITLGTPSGTVRVEVDGGALTVHVHRPGGVAASLDVSGGALSVNADGHSYHAFGEVTAGSLDTGADGYKIQVNGGACTVTLDTTAPSG